MNLEKGISDYWDYFTGKIHFKNKNYREAKLYFSNFIFRSESKMNNPNCGWFDSSPFITEEAHFFRAIANFYLGDFYDRAIQVSKKINEGAGWNVAIIAYGWAVFLAGLALTGYALILISLSKIAVALMLAVAPFFILMLIFAQTKTLFEGWLRTTLNYALIPIFVYGLLSLLLVLVNKSLVKMEASVTATSEIMTYAAPFLLVCVISVGLLMQVMNLASGIAGGLSLQTMGLGKMAAKGIGAGAGLAGGVGRIHADKALDKAFKTGDHAKNKSPDNGNKDPNAEKVKAAAAENREIKK